MFYAVYIVYSVICKLFDPGKIYKNIYFASYLSVITIYIHFATKWKIIACG